MCNFAPKRSPDEDLDDIWFLWKGFFENYEAYKAGKIPMEDEDKYTLLSIPGPSQYRAFSNFFALFRIDEEQLVKKYSENLHTYNLVDTEQLTARPMLEFLHNLCLPDYEAKGKNIVLASGSFWEQNPKTRKKVISCFTELQGRGAEVNIYARAKETEEGIAGDIGQIKEKCRFGLENRIPIHFIKADKDFVQLEFPHTESCLFRLTMFLDLEKLEPDLKNGKKEELAKFFDKLIKEAL